MAVDRVVAGEIFDLFTGLGEVERLFALFIAPDGDRLVVALRPLACARIEHIADLDAAFVVVGHLVVQLAAVGAVDVGEDGDAVFYLLRRVDQQLARIDRRQQLDPLAGGVLLAQVLALLQVVELTAQQVAAVVGDVVGLHADCNLHYAGYRRAADAVDPSARQYAGE